MASEQKSAGTLNVTVVRPSYFYINGFSNMSEIKHFIVFLCFVYIVTVLGNLCLLAVIYQAKTLHTPKYMIVCNLALVDLCQSTALIPRMLDTFLSGRRYILYEACLSYMFFVSFFVSMQSWTLVILAYDRLIAICFPFRYHSLVSKKSVSVMLLGLWGSVAGIVAFSLRNVDALYFCGSVAIQSFYCDFISTVSLSCTQNPVLKIALVFGSSVGLIGPLLFIVLTYTCIAVAIFRIASTKERLKAMTTCVYHLILVAIYFIPITVATIATLVSPMSLDIKMAYDLSMLILPALLNPIVYSLKTEEVLSAIRGHFSRIGLIRVAGRKRTVRPALIHTKHRNNNCLH